MGRIVEKNSKMVVEISKIRNINSESSINLILTLKSLFDRDSFNIIDEYLQLNDQKDIKIRIFRKSDMSILGNKEGDDLPYVKRYKIERKDLPF
jgi:hypothetical protein